MQIPLTLIAVSTLWVSFVTAQPGTEETASVSGTVASVIEGIPAHIEIGSRHVEAGPDGAFTVKGLPAGDHLLLAQHPGFVNGTATIRLRRGEELVLPRMILQVAVPCRGGPGRLSLSGDLQRGGIRGLIHADLGPRSVIELVLQRPGFPPRVTTLDRAARFAFENLEPGSYKLSARGKGFYPETWTVDVIAGWESHYDESLHVLRCPDGDCWIARRAAICD